MTPEGDVGAAAGLPENPPRLIKIAVLAMGGEGGGVLADWLVDLAEHAGHRAQTTSVPGVAQRTGATIYYVEMLIGGDAQAQPVMALMPLPGDVDIVIASELMEAARAVQRGLVTPERTTMVASTHRVYAIAEKTAMGDGRADSAALWASARGAAARFIGFDMAQAAEDAGSVISAVLFGALAGTGALPFSRAQFEATIERGGVGVKPSLRAFAVAFERAVRGEGSDKLPAPQDAPATAASAGASAGSTVGSFVAQTVPGPAPADAARGDPAPTARHPAVNALLQRAQREHPEAAIRHLVIEGLRRLIDWQDPDWAGTYLDRLATLRQSAAGAAGKGATETAFQIENRQLETLLAEAARHLALWMSWEDTIRVAELKTRDSRFARVRTEVKAGSEQVLAIQEYLHPRLQEIAETLPAALGRHLLSGGWLGRRVDRLASKGRVVETSSLRGFLQLWAVSRMKRWRRASLRWQVETGRIDAWLRDVCQAAARGELELATEIVRCQRLVKGYGDTHARGWRNFETLQQQWRRPGAVTPGRLAALRAAALADEQGHALAAALAAQDPAGA
ncbi:MAG: indolepyruvate oxidoreductase subunit beta family protein [Rubrivivax sp.]